MELRGACVVFLASYVLLGGLTYAVYQQRGAALRPAPAPAG